MVSGTAVSYSLGLVQCLRRGVGFVLDEVPTPTIMAFSTICEEEWSGGKRGIDRPILSLALSSEREKELYKDFKLLCFLVSPVFHIPPSFLLVFN